MKPFKTATPEQVGIPSQAILSLLDRFEQEKIPMHSLLLMRHDKLVLEAYYAPYTADHLHRMFSITKSFTAIAIGILADQGKLHLDDPICHYFKELLPDQPHPWLTSMTIRDMLSMRSCHASTTYKANLNQSWVASFFTAAPTHPPGKLFHYDTSATHTLGALVEKITGMDLLDFLREACLQKVHFSPNAYLLKDPFGVSMGGSGLMATSLDLLKFGYLIGHHGQIEGESLISADYLKQATSLVTETVVTAPCLSEACGYGYQFWRTQKNGYVCYGMGGQLLIFFPEYDLICVTTADTQGISGGNQSIYQAIYQELLPALSDQPYKEDVSLQTTFQQKIAALKISSLPLAASQTAPAYFSSKTTYQIDENPTCITTLSLIISADQTSGVLRYCLGGQICELPFGIGVMKPGLFPAYSISCITSGCWLFDHSFHIKTHLIGETVGSLHIQLVFGHQDVTVFVRKHAEHLLDEYQDLHLYGRQR